VPASSTDDHSQIYVAKTLRQFASGIENGTENFEGEQQSGMSSISYNKPNEFDNQPAKLRTGWRTWNGRTAFNMLTKPKNGEQKIRR
jgi:hypothetical protein